MIGLYLDVAGDIDKTPGILYQRFNPSQAMPLKRGKEVKSSPTRKTNSSSKVG